ncbi:acyl-CoA thioesterase [Geodermatophilus sp. SYSU D00684]
MTGGLAELLDLRPDGPDGFAAGPRRASPERAFGGAVVAQALVAAGRTVPEDRAVHSLHAYFLRAGEAAEPTGYAVERVRDGGSYATRRVRAQQRGRTTLELTASFHRPEPGFAHQTPRLDAPPPEELPGPLEAGAGAEGLLRAWLDRLADRHPLEFRLDGELPRQAAARGEAAAPRQRFWVRSREDLPDGPLVRAAALAYVSDVLLLSTALAPHRTVIGAPDVAAASLDHAVWFHRLARPGEWLYYDQESTWADGGRAMCAGRLFDRSGRLVLTVAQEGTVRPLGPR